MEDKDPDPMLQDGQRSGHDEALEEFASLADSYLLADPGLASDFATVEDELHGPLVKLPLEANRGHSLDPFAWEQSTPDFRNMSIGNWEAGDIRQMIHKARIETGDSNEWSQARDHGAGPITNGKSDSPNSGLMSASSAALQANQPGGVEMRVQNAIDLSSKSESPFLPRLAPKDMGQLTYENEKQHLPHSFSRLLQSRSGGMDHPADVYEPPAQRSSGFPSPACPPSVFTSPHSPGPNPPGMWSHEMQEGSNWMRMRDLRMGGAPPYSSPDGGLEHIIDFSPPDRRHSMGNVSEEPTSAAHHLRSRAASSVDNVGHPLGSKMEQSPRLKGGGKQYMPQLSPLFSPQHPSTPSEAFSSERKRKRLTNGMFHPSPGSLLPQVQAKSVQGGGPPTSRISSTSSPTAQDDLVQLLKSQIEAIDTHTKAIMKDTLYRISRNTNSENGGITPPRPRQSSRNQYLDKLVANFLYNRFEYSDARSGGYAASFPTGYHERGHRVSSLESIKPLIP